MQRHRFFFKTGCFRDRDSGFAAFSADKFDGAAAVCDVPRADPTGIRNDASPIKETC